MAGSMLCSRGMGLSLMSGFTSGNIAGGTNILTPCDKAGVTAASPLLFKSVSIRVCVSKRERVVICPVVKPSIVGVDGWLL